MLRRDCCCICHLQGRTWHSRRVTAVSTCGVSVWGWEQSEQAVGVAADLHAWSFPKAFSPLCPAGCKPKEFLVAGYSTAGQWSPAWFPWNTCCWWLFALWGSNPNSFYLLLSLVLAEPGEGQRVKAPLKFHLTVVSFQAEN